MVNTRSAPVSDHWICPRLKRRSSTDTQVERLKAAGCTVIRTEKASGRSRDDRTELATILGFIQPGDTLTVVKLARLDRSN